MVASLRPARFCIATACVVQGREFRRERRKIAPGGFEPPFSDPKSDVLPLDEGAANRSNLHDCCDRLKQAAHQSITCTASMRASVCVSTTGAFTLRSSDAASGAESNTPNTVEPEPDMPALCAPASRNPWMYRAISGCRRLTGDSRSLLGSRGNDVHPLKLP